MKTEEIQRTPRGRDPYEVSRAFQDTTPLSWSIVDRRGRAAPLSAAGYVLRFGRAYRLRIVSPYKAEDIKEVRILTPPSFLTVEPTLIEKDAQGRLTYTMPFKVSQILWAHIRSMGASVCGDELEVVHDFKPGAFREPQSFLCPIVARPRWEVLVVAIVLGLLFIVVEKVISGVFFPEKTVQDTIQTMLGTFSRGDWWIRFLIAAIAVWLVVNGINLVLLYKRSRELRTNFRETYPT